MKQPIEIHILGPLGTYTHQAAQNICEKYGITAPIVVQKTIPDAIWSANEDKNAMAVVAVENSTEGVVNATMDTIVKCKNLGVLANTILPIRHALLSRGKDIEQIRQVSSHPQALAQCREFIKTNLKNADLVEATSTAGAASNLHGTHQACIASAKAAGKYGLQILNECINDEPSNQTRFALLGDKNIEMKRGRKNSTLVSIILKNKSGALNCVTTALAQAGVNMSNIISRPIAQNPGEHMFYIEFDGHVRDGNVAKLLGNLKTVTESIQIIGSYETPKRPDVMEKE
jgi:prephenate dehydratase